MTAIDISDGIMLKGCYLKPLVVLETTEYFPAPVPHNMRDPVPAHDQSCAMDHAMTEKMRNHSTMMRSSEPAKVVCSPHAT